MVTKATDSDFKELIANNNNVVVKFFADWCGVCRLFAPKFVKISNKPEHEGILFLDVNAEQNPEARKFAGVSNLPFFAVIKNGKIIASDTTAKEDALEQMIAKLNNQTA
jgi:thiol-disulfide isomerase/thioredoxin